MTETPRASVVILLGSRFEELSGICTSLRRILTPVTGPYEVILVDEALDHAAGVKVRAVGKAFPEVRIIRLQRSMGEATALAIGTQAARGEILITIDPYLHVSLEELPKLIEPLQKNGTDLVCAWRYPRQESGLSRAASAAFNGVARWITKVSVHDLNCRTRVMRRAVLTDLPIYGDLHRFLPIFASRRGHTWCEVQVPQQPGKREIGAFDIRSYVGRLLDLLTLAFLTRFVKRPLHFFGLVGLASVAIGLGITLPLVYQRIVFDVGLGHRPLLLLGVLLVVMGIQIASIGLLGELMIFTHARDLKDYVVQEDSLTEGGSS